MKKLFYNGKIYTLQKEGETVEAIVIDKGIISKTGSFNDCRNQLLGNDFVAIDLKGKTVLPSFIDSHLHLIGHAEKIQMIDLSEIHKKEDIIERLSNSINEHKNNFTIYAEGFSEENLHSDVLTKEDLDTAFPNIPVAIVRVCYHTMLVNEAAIKKWNVMNWDVPNNQIGKDGMGNLNGYLYEAAMQKGRSYAKTYSDEILEQLVQKGIEDAKKYGITSIVTEDLAYYGDFEKTMQAFIKASKMANMRMHLLVNVLVWEEVKRKGYFEHDFGSFLRLEAVKLFLDGALGSRTAHLLEPYSDQLNEYGIKNYTSSELHEIIKKIREAGLTVAFHMIGDGAFCEALDVLEKYPPVKENQKDRLIHVSMIPNNGIKRLKKLPAVYDLQPLFFSSDMPWVKDRIGDERVKQAYLLKTLLNEKLLCGGSSDSPIEDINPWKGIWSSVTRKSNHDHKIYEKQEALSLYEAISLYTSGGAKTLHQNDVLGKIQENYWADIQIYEKNPFETTTDELCDLRPEAVLVNGSVIYKKTSYE